MKNRKWMALALAAAMVGSLTACGGGSGTADTTAAAAAADTTAAPAADTTAAADAQAPAGDGTGLVLSLIHIYLLPVCMTQYIIPAGLRKFVRNQECL